MALVAAAILPMTAFGIIVLAIEGGDRQLDPNVARLVLFALVTVVILALIASFLLVADLIAPLRSIAAAVDRVSAGDLSTPIDVPGDDELAQLADSHNRLAADLGRRDQELGRIRDVIEHASPRQDVASIVKQAADDARASFGMIDAVVYLGNPINIAVQEVVPGESRPLRAVLDADGKSLGVLVGRLPATRRWERADEDLFEVFASHVAASIRTAQLFARVESQNAQLRELDEAKDEFLRGVSHNLQTPLTSIRAHAAQLAEAQPDRRLGIIAEQSDRLSRMVRQLLTVTRLESGAFKPRADVVALGARTRKAWEALGADDVPFTLDDGADGWLAIADADQLDQVLWALLDNALKYGGRTPVSATVRTEPDASRLRLTIRDGGPGISEADRERLFARFARGAGKTDEGSEGSGLGLYVSRELSRAMGGDLILEPAVDGQGATFSLYLPGESAAEG